MAAQQRRFPIGVHHIGVCAFAQQELDRFCVPLTGRIEKGRLIHYLGSWKVEMMARMARNSKSSHTKVIVYRINPFFLKVPSLGPYRPYLPNLKCLTVWFVVERVETTLPTSVFQVEVPHGKVARLRGPTSYEHTSLLVYSLCGLPLWPSPILEVPPSNRKGNNLLFVHLPDPLHSTNETGFGMMWVKPAKTIRIWG